MGAVEKDIIRRRGMPEPCCTLRKGVTMSLRVGEVGERLPLSYAGFVRIVVVEEAHRRLCPHTVIKANILPFSRFVRTIIASR